jgi:hypothetical protein
MTGAVIARIEAENTPIECVGGVEVTAPPGRIAVGNQGLDGRLAPRFEIEAIFDVVRIADHSLAEIGDTLLVISAVNGREPVAVKRLRGATREKRQR